MAAHFIFSIYNSMQKYRRLIKMYVKGIRGKNRCFLESLKSIFGLKKLTKLLKMFGIEICSIVTFFKLFLSQSTFGHSSRYPWRDISRSADPSNRGSGRPSATPIRWSLWFGFFLSFWMRPYWSCLRYNPCEETVSINKSIFSFCLSDEVESCLLISTLILSVKNYLSNILSVLTFVLFNIWYTPNQLFLFFMLKNKKFN